MFCIKRDYAVYLLKLREYAEQFDVSIHSFVLMTNHVHLLATPQTEGGVSRMIQSLGRYYVRYFNKQHRRTGTLWEGRFKASIIDTDRYFLVISRYIELNPVRAKMVAHPADYTWSSIHFNGGAKPIELLTPHELYLSLGSTPFKRAQSYSLLFENEIPNFRIEEIRCAINSTRVLGSDVFKRQIEEKTGLTLIPKPWGGVRLQQ